VASAPVSSTPGANAAAAAAQVWKSTGSGWESEAVLSSHTDWVRDVAWAPNLGLPYSTIASAGQDGQVGRAQGGWPPAGRLPAWLVQAGCAG
jgi:protein transport protein SEC13